LAVGGCVRGDILQCPFHGWEFRQDGTVASVQGCAEHAPLKTKAETYIALERNQMILVWLDGAADAARRGRADSKHGVVDAPRWQVPVEPCLDAMQFVGIVEHVVAAHIQEIPENGADAAHLLTVHAPFVVPALSGTLDHDWDFTWTPGAAAADQHTAVVGMKLGLRVRGALVDALAVKVHVTQVGPALVHEHLTLPLGLGEVYVASTVTPMRPLLQRYTHLMWASASVPRFLPKMLLRGLLAQVNRDVPIWNSKTYRARPFVAPLLGGAHTPRAPYRPYSVQDVNLAKFRKRVHSLSPASANRRVHAGGLRSSTAKRARRLRKPCKRSATRWRWSGDCALCHVCVHV